MAERAPRAGARVLTRAWLAGLITAAASATAIGAVADQRGAACIPSPPPGVALPPGGELPACPTVPGPAPAEPAVPLRSQGPLTIVYDFAAIAQHLHAGTPRLRGLGGAPRTVRQFPLGEPFGPERWLGKVNRAELAGRSAARIAALLEAGMSRHRLGDIASGFVALDEVGADFEDPASGPELLSAMRILAQRRHPATGEPLNRRVLMYAAPKMVSNVGSGNDRGQWDAALAAARLSGGVYLQMYHAESGVVTGPFTSQEWREYLPVWKREMGSDFSRLRVILSNGRGVPQDEQWRRARQSAAGRAVLRHGVGAYNLRTRAEATAWLRNWNRHSR